MLIVIAGFPGAFIHAFFSGSLLIETIFSLDGLGLLGFQFGLLESNNLWDYLLDPFAAITALVYLSSNLRALGVRRLANHSTANIRILPMMAV